jgi:Transposase zinc-ribbon domain
MAQHFLLSAAARSLNLAQVFRMTETEAEAEFRKVRWPETNGEPVCPVCGTVKVYDCRRPHGAPRWRCAQKECKGKRRVSAVGFKVRLGLFC